MRALAAFAAVAVIATACTWPFVRPYLELRGLEFPKRPLAEVAAFSADVRSYATAHAAQWVWEHASACTRSPKASCSRG